MWKKVRSSFEKFLVSVMDFTQHNKINSKVQRNLPTRHCHDMADGQQIQVQPKFPQQFRDVKVFKPCTTDMIQSQRSMETSYVPQASRTSNIRLSCEDTVRERSTLHHQFDNEEPNKAANVEYYQFTPSHSSIHRQSNPFKQVIDSMRKYSSCKATNQKQHSQANHQTFECAHDESVEHEQQFTESYRSHTKILAIPNGVRIVTEILNDDNGEFQGKANLPTGCQMGSTWMNKQIEVTVEEDGDSDNQ